LAVRGRDKVRAGFEEARRLEGPGAVKKSAKASPKKPPKKSTK
jgi:hypothetical protein